MVLENIDLLRNNITVEGAAPLVQLFSERRHLESICGVEADDTFAFHNNSNFSDADAVLMAAELKFNVSITQLDLWRNDITTEGAKALASAIRVNDSLTHLDLSSNEIDEVGATALFSSLHTNKNLTYLDLGDNEICGIDNDLWTNQSIVPGIVSLAKALKHNEWEKKTILLGDKALECRELEHLIDAVSGLAIVCEEESDDESDSAEG